MRRLAVCLMAVLLLSGCEALPFARELEATMLVQVLGVDWTEDGVTLTAASDPSTGSGDSKAAVLTASGVDLVQAKSALEAAGEEYVALTHVSQLVLGADTELSLVLEAALQEPALGQGATVWLVSDGSAKELLEGVGGGAKRLSSIELNAGVTPVTVLQGMMRLEEGARLELPVLTLKGEALSLEGTKLIRGEMHGT